MTLVTYKEYKVLPLLARTNNLVSDTIILPPEIKTLKFLLNITAVTGTTPTLDVVAEELWDFIDGGPIWFGIGSLSTKNAVGKDVLAVTTTPFTRKVRMNCGIGGTTPNFTFEVGMVAKS